MPWLISHFPELDHLEPIQRARLLNEVPWWTYPQIAARAVFLGLVAGGITEGLVSSSMALGPALICCTLVAGAVALWRYRYEINFLRRVMRQEIAKGFVGERTPFCFACGYNLTHLAADTCPECGKFVGGAARADGE